jgi:hypothetical protein
VQFRLLGREAAVLANVHLLREKIKSRLKLINIQFSLNKKFVLVCLLKIPINKDFKILKLNCARINE